MLERGRTDAPHGGELNALGLWPRGLEPEQTTLLSLPGSEASPFILQQEWQGTRDHVLVKLFVRAEAFQEAIGPLKGSAPN